MADRERVREGPGGSDEDEDAVGAGVALGCKLEQRVLMQRERVRRSTVGTAGVVRRSGEAEETGRKNERAQMYSLMRGLHFCFLH